MTATAVEATPSSTRRPSTALATVAAAMLAGGLAAGAIGAAGGALVVVVAYLYGDRLLAPRTLLAGLVLVILFVPIGRYTLPGGLPFQLEPYRIYVAALVLIWVAALLIDPSVRFRLAVLGGPLLALLVVASLSEIGNPE